MLRVILLTLILICFFSEQVGAQSNYDTLYYYDPYNIEACPLILHASIVNLAVKFEPISNRSYSIREIHLLIAPDPSGFYSIGDTAPICIHSAGTDTSPGKILLEIPVTINGSSEIYPNWKIIDLSSYSELSGLIGDFWVSGLTVLSSLVHNPFLSTFNENTFVYSNMRWVKKGAPGLFIKAVIEYEGMEINEKVGAEYPLEFLTYSYPNPFNISTNIVFYLPFSSDILLTIYDLTGNVIKEYSIISCLPGYNEVKWDGRNKNGIIVPTGVYLYKVSLKGASAKTHKEKITFIR
ncbi:MAG: hypothetical protein H0Z29_01665 [Candidatus Marinimicrobia bacterium]|nr:hypothetical protein [Candidatus Neomarinimicrobiota bacterium]